MRKRLRVGHLSVYIEPRDIWVGVFVATHAIYVCPLPLLVVKWSFDPCRWEDHEDCPGCLCECHQPWHTCVPFDPPARRLVKCQRCRDEDSRESAP